MKKHAVLSLFLSTTLLGMISTINIRAVDDPKVAPPAGQPPLQFAEGMWRFYPAAMRHPGRARVLLIGDSIVNGYHNFVIKALDDTADVDVWLTPLHENSPQLHHDLQAVLRQGPYDVIHFNIGLHGWEAGSIPEGRYVPLMEEYVRILRQEAPHATWIWASSTPVLESGKPELHHQINPIISERNRLAAGVMRQNNITANDLHSLMTGKLDLSEGDRCHWKTEGYQILGETVTASIRAAMRNRAPADCPFPKSETFTGIRFTGRHAEYTRADTWYPSWASDDKMYAPFTDGTVNGLKSGSADRNATTGAATIIGDDPLHLIVTNQSVYVSQAAPYPSRYPCGSLVYNGVWYYGTYCLTQTGTGLNWDIMGPFVGFRYSTDFGKTWTQTPCTPANPLFGETNAPVKIGSPHFVDFGKNMEHSPDGKAYLVAHGASDSKNRRPAYNSWINGDEIYLLRVTPSIENMNDASKYEFFDGTGWTKDFNKIKPVATWRDNMGCVTMTYNAPLKKYLMCVTDGGNTLREYNTYILEANSINGSWKLLKYMRHFGKQGYFVNIPSKFISADGRTAWLCYSANWNHQNKNEWIDPPGSEYAMCLQEFKLARADEPAPAPGPLESTDNIAPLATVSVSSTHPDYAPGGAVDGVVDGFPGDLTREWASHGERETATLRLTWNGEQTMDRVELFDRPNHLDQITGGMLIFSDGSTLPVGALPDDALQGCEVHFPAKRIKWLIFAVTAVKPGSLNIGLSEIAVFRRSSSHP